MSSKKRQNQAASLDQTQQLISQNELIQALLVTKSESSNEEPKGIQVSPMTAVIGLIGLICVLIQCMIGFGMWSIQDRLDRYDSYEKRITSIEQTIVRFEFIANDITQLRKDFALFASEPKFNEKQNQEKLDLLITPLKEKFIHSQEEIDKNTSIILKMEDRVKFLEQEQEFIKRARNNDTR